MNLSEWSALGAVLFSVVSYAISYFQSKKTLAKNQSEYEKNQAIKEVMLIDRIEHLEQHQENSIAIIKELKDAINNLNKTLESINIKLAITSTEITNLKDKVK